MDKQDLEFIAWQRIESLGKNEWVPLLDLIPTIKKEQENFQAKINSGLQADLSKEYSLFNSEVISKFHEIAYAIGIIINFDWSKWDEGREMLANDNFDFDSIDIYTKCKLLTAILRSNRFCEGELQANFENGIIPEILFSIDRQINS